MSSGVSGQIVSIQGEVLNSQPLGLATATAGAPVRAGSQVVTRSGSSATVLLGSCNVAMTENSELVISAVGENMCVQVSEVAAPPSANGLPVAIGIGAAAAVGALAIGGGGDAASQ